MAEPALIDAVEHAYRAADDPARWLAGVVDLLRPSLDRGSGVLGWFYDARDFRNLRFAHPVLRGVDPALVPAIGAAAADEHTTIEMTRRHYATPAGPFSRSLGAAFQAHVGWRRFVVPTGVRDLVVLNAIDPDRQGCAILAPRKQVTTATPARIALLSRVTAHLAAARRLVQRPPAEPEAVLSASGRVEHAVGPARAREAREALARAGRAMDRARGRLRRLDPEESLKAWRAMVDGRWTLVDRFDSDGRHFVVARVNVPVAPRVARLSERERQVAAWAALGHANKLIAYELGVAPSTVATHLESSIRKLRLRSTLDLARVFPDALPEGRDPGPL